MGEQGAVGQLAADVGIAGGQMEGAPRKPSEAGFVGRGGARERA